MFNLLFDRLRILLLPALCIIDDQIIKLPECQQTQDSDSFFASLDTILFQYTEQIQSQTQTKTSPIIIQDESPLVSVGPSVSIYSREMIGIMSCNIDLNSDLVTFINSKCKL